MIPEAAVEAAYKRLGGAVTYRDVSIILEAAAPHMLDGRALLSLADDMEAAIHGGPESIGRNGRRFNASERIRKIVSDSWPACPPRTEGSKPHCPDCSGIVGETGIVW